MNPERISEQIFVANAHPTLEVDPERVTAVASQVLTEENRRGAGVNVILATDTDLRNMNSQYLGQNRPTDVLAFSMGGNEHPPEEEQVMGEVYISLDRAQQQAREYQVTLEEEVDRLVIHGLLHLCGYDHEEDEEAQQMKAKEERFLESFR
jgi:probable rRNA maturation factor